MRLSSSAHPFTTLALLLSSSLHIAAATESAPPPVSAPEIAGLKVEVTTPASCTRRSQPGDKLSMAYRGTLVDGSEFDSSAGGPAFVFKLGAHEVIKGWDMGLGGMCIGEGRRLTIAPELAYGNRGLPGIPPGSTLIFDVTLEGIAGVQKEEQDKPEKLPPMPVAAGPEDESQKPDKDHKDPPSNGECRLLGPFAILIQGALGALALLALVWKRWRERPRRPVKIWAFDVSKQVMGSVLLHMANLFISMLFSGDFDVKTAIKTANQGDMPNPCSFYLLNLAIDTTIGIPILVLLLRILHALFSYTWLANPPESIQSGNYGHPPKVTWWLKQSFIYFLGLFGMKVCVFLLFQLLPWLGWVGDWALRWTEGNEALQIAFVMLVFPLIMNVLQYWVIDSFIKDKAGRWQEDTAGADDADDEQRGLMGDEGRRHSEDGEDAEVEEVSAGQKGLKEVNPTPVPAYGHGSGSSGSSADSRKYAGESDKDR